MARVALTDDTGALYGAPATWLNGTYGAGLPDPQSQPWDIVIVAGQSNSWETDYPAFNNTEPDPRVLSWDAVAGAAQITPAKNDEVGFAFARNYANTHLAAGRKVLTIRSGYGETGFSTTSIDPPPAGYTLAPNGTWDRHLTSDPLNRFHEMISTAKAVRTAAPAGSRIVALIWSQGEQDRWKVEASGSGWYSTKLDDHMAKARTDLALPELPIIVMSQTPETITGTTGGGLINRAHEDTPRRLKWSSYVYGPEGYSKTNETVHFSTPGHTVRGALASSAFPKTKLNNSVIRPGAPLGLTLDVLGTSATARWVSPVQRVTSYELEYSTDLGSSWRPVPLAHAMALSATFDVPLDAPVWVRARSSNEYSSPSQWTPVVSTTGGAMTATPALTDAVAMTLTDYTNRWVAAQQTDGALSSMTPHTGADALVQATADAQPTVLTDGVKLVRFDGVNDDLYAPVANGTITVVARSRAAVGTNNALFSTGPNYVRRTSEATPRIGTTIQGQANQFHDYTEGTTFHVFTFIADGTTGAMSIDGGYTLLNGAVANTQILLARYGTTNFGNMDVTEVIAWNRALTSAECADVYADLKAGYPAGVIA